MDRRKMLALLGASPVLVADSPAYARTGTKSGSEHPHRNGDGEGERITVMNPAIAGKLAERKGTGGDGAGERQPRQGGCHGIENGGLGDGLGGIGHGDISPQTGSLIQQIIIMITICYID